MCINLQITVWFEHRDLQVLNCEMGMYEGQSKRNKVKELRAQRNVIQIGKISRFNNLQTNAAIWTWCEKQTGVRDRTRRAERNTSPVTKGKGSYNWTDIKKNILFVCLTLYHASGFVYLFKINFWPFCFPLFFWKGRYQKQTCPQ